MIEYAKITFLVIYFCIYGWYEANLFAKGFHPGANDVFGIISSRYHFPMFVFLVFPCIIFNYGWLFPALLIIEDQSYFIFEPRDELDSEDWIAKILGGNHILGQFIPNLYFLLIVVSLALYTVS